MTPASDLEWMTLQVDALFVADARGRLQQRRGPGSDVELPPRFFFGRTRHGNLWRFAAGLPETLLVELARLAAAERIGRPLEAPPERIESFRARLEAEAPIESVYHGPAFRFPEPEAAAGADPGIVHLTPERVELLGEEFAALRPVLALRQPCFAALSEGRAVAACYVAARSPRAAEAGVETLPGFRGRGLASRATASWARRRACGGTAPALQHRVAEPRVAGRGRAARPHPLRGGSPLPLRRSSTASTRAGWAPRGGATRIDTPGCRSAAAAARRGMSRALWRPGARKKGSTTTSRAPRAAQRATASPRSGGASSR